MINYKFYEGIIKINTNFSDLKFYQSIFYYELKHFNDVIRNNNPSIANLLHFFEEGIIFPLYLYSNKFIAFLDSHTGYEYLKLYELVYLFLLLKKYIVENRAVLDKFVPIVLKHFFHDISLNKKHKHILLHANFGPNELKELEKDIKELSKPDFEVLNYKRVFQYLEKHLYDFIYRPKSKMLVDFFSKKK